MDVNAPRVDLTGRCAVVTGAGHGLGRAFALDLAARGAAVVVDDVGTADDGTASAESVAAEIRAAGGTAVAVTASVAEPAGAEEIAATAVERFGRIDALVNNAGLVHRQPLAEYELERLDALLAVNLRGTLLTTRAALPAMLAAGYGRIVTIASGAGYLGLAGQAVYGATKSAAIGLTRAVAAEGGGRGVLANAVLPWAVTNPGRTRLDWPAEDLAAVAPRAGAEWVTPLVTYLSSPACAGGGESYSALGGRYARVAVAVGEGWLAPGSGPPAPGDLAVAFADVERLDGAAHPPSFEAELAAVAERLRRAGGLDANVRSPT
ncbi:MAG: SDR family NAD(P)-dependent oxidoreductase [Solirubrobacterales bacterium]|nr:SDR family NAD(P)-dependent oxidoreductase [Solirubrobacterales bacterium]